MFVFTGLFVFSVILVPTENKYSSGNKLKQEEEIVDEAAGQEEEGEGGIHLLAVCLEGMLTVAFLC